MYQEGSGDAFLRAKALLRRLALESNLHQHQISIQEIYKSIDKIANGLDQLYVAVKESKNITYPIV